MHDTLREAYERSELIDITTIGARTGSPRRIEIAFHHFDGTFYITGRPGRARDWLANLHANPEFTVHLKQSSGADIPATAAAITDPDERARILYRILVESWGNPTAKADHILPRWVEGAPLVRFDPI